MRQCALLRARVCATARVLMRLEGNRMEGTDPSIVTRACWLAVAHGRSSSSSVLVALDRRILQAAIVLGRSQAQPVSCRTWRVSFALKNRCLLCRLCDGRIAQPALESSSNARAPARIDPLKACLSSVGPSPSADGVAAYLYLLQRKVSLSTIDKVCPCSEHIAVPCHPKSQS